jgi:hypothetical protein
MFINCDEEKQGDFTSGCVLLRELSQPDLLTYTGLTADFIERLFRCRTSMPTYGVLAFIG